MSILVDKNTRVLCQGMGKAGTFHAIQCREYGTQIVGGVVPGKGGTSKEGFPLFNTVAEAVGKTGANATMIFVPASAAADAIMEAADAGIAVIVAITEGIPVLDMAQAMRFLEDKPAAGSSGRTVPASSRPASARSASCPATSTSPAPSASSAAAVRSPTRPSGSCRTSVSANRRASASAATRSSAPSQIDLLKLFQDDPQTEGDFDDGRDRRHRRGAGRRVRQGARDEAGRGVHRRPDGAAGQAHGPRRRDHQRRQRHRRGQDRRSAPPASLSPKARPILASRCSER